MPLALPLGELSPQVTERAHAVSPVLKYQTQQETFPPCQRLPPRGSWQNRQVLTEGVKLLFRGSWHRAAITERVGVPLRELSPQAAEGVKSAPCLQI